jgi:hypothetical protein
MSKSHHLTESQLYLNLSRLHVRVLVLYSAVQYSTVQCNTLRSEGRIEIMCVVIRAMKLMTIFIPFMTEQ